MLGLSERAEGLRIRICTDPPTKIFYLAVISASRSLNRGLGSGIWTWGPAWFALRKISGFRLRAQTRLKSKRVNRKMRDPAPDPNPC